MIRILTISFFIIQGALSYSQSYWKITSERGEQLLLTIEVNERKNEFEAYTRKDALRDIAGTVNYVLALTAGKVQFPEIIYIEGKTSKRADTLVLSGTFYYIEKRFPFEAVIHENRISGKFTDYRNRLNRMEGVKVAGNRPVNDYSFIINTANSLSEKYLFDAQWLRSKEWTEFREKINELRPLIADDYEIGAAYFWLGKNLPFHPYELNRENPQRKQSQSARKIYIREPEPKTALIDATMLPANTKEMDTLAMLIEKKGCTNLILDLRGRGRISPESAEYLICYLTKKQFTGGVYPTRKFFQSNKSLPASKDYPKYFRSFTTGNLKPNEYHNEPGRYFDFTPAAKQFKGKVFILTDTRTSGVASAFTYLAKKHNLATIVGMRASVSAGLSERLTINNDFSLTLVVSEFYTPEGSKITEADLDPNTFLPDQDALKYVLKYN